MFFKTTCDTGEVNSFIIIILEAGIFFKNRIIYIPTENATPIKKGRCVSDDHLMTVPHIHHKYHSPGTWRRVSDDHLVTVPHIYHMTLTWHLTLCQWRPPHDSATWPPVRWSSLSKAPRMHFCTLPRGDDFMEKLLVVPLRRKGTVAIKNNPKISWKLFTQ